MEESHLLHCLETLAGLLDISLVYSRGGSLHCFQPFRLSAPENDLAFILRRLRPAFRKFPDRSVMYCITGGRILIGILRNLSTGDFLLVGPMAGPACTAGDIRRYLAQTGVEEATAQVLGAYLENSRPLTQRQLLDLLSHLNTLVNAEVVPPARIEALYDDLTSDRMVFAQREYRREAARQDSLDTEAQSQFSARMAFCVEYGDVEGLYSLLNATPALAPDPEPTAEEFRILALGSVFAAEGAALRSGIPAGDLEKTKHYYLSRVAAAMTLEELQQLTARSLFDFTRLVREFLPQRTENPTINRAIHYIKANLNARIRVADIAAALGINPHYLHSRFRAETGKTVTEFLNSERIKKACYYLQFTDKPVSEIAAFLSFSSQSHFQATFKKHMGLTPKQWRQRNDYAR